MMQIKEGEMVLTGPRGEIKVREDDEISRKLVMLYEGECTRLGPINAARKFGYSKQRYYQIRQAFEQYGATGLKSCKTGPKRNYRRTEAVERQVIRYRFLDPDISAEVIAQRLDQDVYKISIRSVQRIIEQYGLQKKTPQVSAGCSRARGVDATH